MILIMAVLPLLDNNLDLGSSFEHELTLPMLPSLATMHYLVPPNRPKAAGRGHSRAEVSQASPWDSLS
jgi:hypothetical protein